MMHEVEKSDLSEVAGKPANACGRAQGESVERREGTKGNTSKHGTRWTLSQESVLPGLDRVRERAKSERKEQFTALLHHIDVDLLRSAFSRLKREAAPGVDGRTWQQYQQNLDVNLADLHSRVHRGAYQALPSRRTYIPKGDGQRAFEEISRILLVHGGRIWAASRSARMLAACATARRCARRPYAH